MAPQLTWFRFQTALPRNPKVQALLATRDGATAFFVYISALSYSAEHGTCGFVPAEVLSTFGGRDAVRYADRYAKLLEEVTLFEPAPGGWFIHDWDIYAKGVPDPSRVRARNVEAARARWNGHTPMTGAQRQAAYRARRARRDGDDSPPEW
jgi:hypothetical protein